MDIIEANKIFNVWRIWVWPCHSILYSIFTSKIPETYIPYPIDVLEEALNIVAKDYWDNGDRKTSNNIQETASCLVCYEKDEVALQWLADKFSAPPEMKMEEIMPIYISNFKRDWLMWVEKLDKQEKGGKNE